MKFLSTPIEGAFVLEPELVEDERGFFARTWCQNEAKRNGLVADFVQCSISFNRLKGTLRGLHVQSPPFGEAKLVRCTQGAVFDVIVDLRRESSTYKQVASHHISAENRLMCYVPPGVAHGFQTLTPDAELFYQISEFYHPDAAGGVRWNDPALGITWPLEVSVISEKDKSLPLL